MTSLLLTLLLACGPEDKGTPADTARSETGRPDSGETAETGDTAVVSLHGSPPSEAVPLPEFTATNRDGSARGPSDLVGHPTVMWFYPAAGTAG